MSARLTVIFYIVLCLEAGIVLTFLPWTSPFGLSDWGDNFFLVLASQKSGLHALQHAVSSGWVRGAVTGLGLLNLGMAFWEIFNFRQTVGALGTQAAAGERTTTTATTDGASAANARDASRSASPGELPR
jgi:hypothetical protein